MLKELSWFKFVSRKEQEKQDAIYAKKMFPFGQEQQKQTEIELMQSLLTKRMDKQEIIYNLLCVKQALMEEENADKKQGLALWYKSKNLSHMEYEEKMYFVSAASLILIAKSLDEFPSKQLVIDNLNGICDEYAYLNKNKKK